MSNPADIVADYRLVRMVALALATLAFLVGLAKLGASDLPHEHSRAQDLLVKSALVFLLVAGDRLLVRGMTAWFGVDPASLPVFWQ